MTMQTHDGVSHPELRRPARSAFYLRLGICGLLAAVVLCGVALAQSGRSGQSANPGASAPAPFDGNPASPLKRAPGEPSLLGGYLVYDWEGPIPTFHD
jgi:hypothetical protein